MTSLSIVAPIAWLKQIGRPFWSIVHLQPSLPPQRSLTYWAHHLEQLPPFVQQSTVAQRYVVLLGQLDWEHFPERPLHLYGDKAPIPYAPFVAACLVKLDQHLPYLASLRQFLVDNPALLWVLGFPLALTPQ